MNNRLITFTFLIGLLLPCYTQAEQAPIPWDSLSAQQQQVLKKFENRWDDFPAQRQSKLRKGVDHWQQLTPQQKQMAKQKFKHWKKLPAKKNSSYANALMISCSCLRKIVNA